MGTSQAGGATQNVRPKNRRPVMPLFPRRGSDRAARVSPSARRAAFHVSVPTPSRLCRPMCCSPPGSSSRAIFQARILERVAISFSRGSSHPRDQTHVSCVSQGEACSLSFSCVVKNLLSARQEPDAPGWRREKETASVTVASEPHQADKQANRYQLTRLTPV